MKKDEVRNYIKQIWNNDPLIDVDPSIAPATMEGIEQQLEAGNKLILFMINQDGNHVIKTVAVDYS